MRSSSPSLREAFAQPAALTMFFFGFTSGLPFLLVGAGRYLLDLRERRQGDSSQAGGEEGEGQSASENMHRFSRFP